MLLVGAVGGFLLSREHRSAASPACDGPAARISSYEWRESAWRTESARSDLVARADALCLDRVYVDITAAAVADGPARQRLAADITALVREAQPRGIEVGAVAGDPWWPSPQGHVDADAVLRFVGELDDAGAGLTGLHVDVEPWGLAEWPERKSELSVAYLEFVEHVEARRDEIDLATPVTYLIPYWFDGSNGEAPRISFAGESQYPFDHLVNTLHDGAALSVMAYRDRALGEGGIVDLARHEFTQERVPVLIGVETAPIEPATATFAAADLSTLRDQLRMVADQTGTSEIVINDLPNLWQLATST
jgi:hypothetical protein